MTILTAEFGKLDIIAKGARKAGSRLAGSTEPLAMGRYTWAAGRNRRFLIQVQPRKSFSALRTDYIRLSVALSWLEALSDLLPYESPEANVASLGFHALELIAESPAPVVALLWSLVQLLKADGREPNWTTCATTGHPIQTSPTIVSPMAGGPIEAHLRDRFSDSFSVPLECLIGLKKIGELDLPPPRMKFSTEALRVLLKFLSCWIDAPLTAGQRLLSELESSGMYNEER